VVHNNAKWIKKNRKKAKRPENETWLVEHDKEDELRLFLTSKTAEAYLDHDTIIYGKYHTI